MRKHNLIYKTVNLINSKFYIGKHSTDNLDDGYLGSGLLISSAITLYGRENFKREIMFDVQTPEQASIIECQIVNEKLLANPECYNIALGGIGGNLGPEVNKKIGEKMSMILSGVPKTEEHKQALRTVWKEKNHTLDNELKERIKRTITQTWTTMDPTERKIKCGHPGKKNGFFGKKHSENSLEKMKLNLPDRKGNNNPRAKKVTINNVTYGSLKECMEKLQISKRKLYKLLGESQ